MNNPHAAWSQGAFLGGVQIAQNQSEPSYPGGLSPDPDPPYNYAARDRNPDGTIPGGEVPPDFVPTDEMPWHYNAGTFGEGYGPERADTTTPPPPRTPEQIETELEFWKERFEVADSTMEKADKIAKEAKERGDTGAVEAADKVARDAFGDAMEAAGNTMNLNLELEELMNPPPPTPTPPTPPGPAYGPAPRPAPAYGPASDRQIREWRDSQPPPPAPPGPPVPTGILQPWLRDGELPPFPDTPTEGGDPGGSTGPATTEESAPDEETGDLDCAARGEIPDGRGGCRGSVASGDWGGLLNLDTGIAGAFLQQVPIASSHPF